MCGLKQVSRLTSFMWGHTWDQHHNGLCGSPPHTDAPHTDAGAGQAGGSPPRTDVDAGQASGSPAFDA